jgi:hypothetical protein
MFHVALDGAALAGGIAAFEQHDDLLAAVAHPALHLQQLDLQLFLLRFVVGAADTGAIRIARRQRRVIAVFAAAVRRMRHRHGDRIMADRLDFGGRLGVG